MLTAGILREPASRPLDELPWRGLHHDSRAGDDKRPAPHPKLRIGMRDVGFYRLPQTAAEASFLIPFYRTSDIYDFCCELNRRLSMLHPDTLALLHHFGRYFEGPILELGPYVGGSTVALGKGVVGGDAGAE